MMKTRLKDLRISAGLTQKEVANAFGLKLSLILVMKMVYIKFQ